VLADSVTTNEFFRVVAGGSSGFAFVGTFYEADTKIWLTQLSGLGDEQWSRTHGRLSINGSDEGYGVAALADGWVAVGTETLWWYSETEPFLGVNNPWLVRSDDEGNALWAARFSVPGAALVVTATNDGGVVAAGLVSVDGQTEQSIHGALWLARWDD
jgi:hypothetical protein